MQIGYINSNCHEAAEKIYLITNMMATAAIMRESIHQIKGSSSVDLCSWLYYSLSPDCSSNNAQEAIVLNELKAKDGYCTFDWSGYTGDHCSK